MRVELPHCLAGNALGGPHAHLKEARDGHQRRHDEGGHERERQAERHHRRRDREQAGQLGHQRGDAAGEQRVDRLHVGGTAADHVAQRRTVEVGQRQLLVMGEQPHA